MSGGLTMAATHYDNRKGSVRITSLKRKTCNNSSLVEWPFTGTSPLIHMNRLKAMGRESSSREGTEQRQKQ